MDTPALSYAQRLETFRGVYDGNEATAQQLAAIGHVCDRPPLEALEEGSRCIDCSQFLRREISVRALEGPWPPPGHVPSLDDFHLKGCYRSQCRLPFDQLAAPGESFQVSLASIKKRFEASVTVASVSRSTSPSRPRQTSSFFTLPAELRLEIYAMILPELEPIQEIVTINSSSPRVMTSQGFRKAGPRDLTQTSILRVCRTIHSEALSILYHNRRYIFSKPIVMYSFLRSIGRSGRNLIEAVDITCGTRDDAVAFALLGSCSALNAICIRLARPKLILSRAPIWMNDGVAALLEISGLQSVVIGDCGQKAMTEATPDAGIIRRELTRCKGSPGGVRSIRGVLDL